jgi:hypothetical protein
MNAITHHIQRIFNRYLLDGARDRKDVLAMQVLTPLSVNDPYLPWSQFSMRPSGIVAVLNEIVTAGKQCIVECGGGISTMYIGRLLRSIGSKGHLYSIENDQAWAEILEGILEREQLAQYVTVVYAPLAPSSYTWDGKDMWYAENALKCVKALTAIDMLIVDGPPAYSKELRHARYPAVPFFKDSLSPNYTIVLDDINRLGEQEIVERWERELGVKFQNRFLNGTIALGRQKAAFVI